MTPHDGSPLGGDDPALGSPTSEPVSMAQTDDLFAVEHPVLLPKSEPLRTVFRVLGRFEEVIGSLLLLAILLLVLALVLTRYIVPGTWPWAGEEAQLCMVWATFLMVGYLVAHHPHHIAIHVIDFVAKGRWLVAIKLFVNLLILGTTTFLIYGNIDLLANDIGQVTPAGQIPLKIVNAIPLIGLFLLELRAILGIVVEDIPGFRSGAGGES